jgi:hypothetical protein
MGISRRMIKNRHISLLTCSILMVSGVVYAEQKQKAFSWNGDVRLRLESDWNSNKADGSERNSRDRARIRLRVNANYQLNDNTSLGVRVRTGSNRSQQSPHYTLLDFNGNDKGDFDLGLDKWFIRQKNSFGDVKTVTWVGRNSLNIWKQNELFWDDDVTVTGVASQFETQVSNKAKLGGSGGVVALPVGLTKYSGSMVYGQLYYQDSYDDIDVKMASGLFDMNADPDDIDGRQLLVNNGQLDHRIWLNSVNIKSAAWPISISVDYMRNISSYSTQELALAKDDNKTGIVTSIDINTLFGYAALSFKYTYADIGALSVNSSYSEDDWMRWGSATETRSSDFSGHEVRFKYKMPAYGNIVLRFYSVDAKSTIEDGDRVRVDWNMKF